jgi:hypothetical protein
VNLGDEALRRRADARHQPPVRRGQRRAQVAKARQWRIYEVGISYFGRTYDEGKKITWRDGLLALWYLLRFRFSRP